jgi:hypothetical protein
MSKSPETSTVNADPWDVASPYMEAGFKEAKNLYNNYTPQYYTGQTQAGFTPDQQTAQQGIRDFATQGAPSIMNPAMSAYQQGVGSNMLDVANNPYVNNMAQSAADRAMGGVYDNLADIRGSAIASGGYGGGRQGIAEGNAIAGAADSANQAAAQIYGQAYGQGLGHQRATLGMTGGLMNAGFSPYSALGASGGQQQGREQALINDAMAQQNFEQNMPYTKLNQYQSGITGFSPLVGNAGQMVTTTPGNTMMSNIGGLAQAYSLLR